MIQSNKNTVVTYTRTAHCSEENMIIQRHQLEDYCNRNDLTITKSYIDYGYSGLTLDRPAFTKLLADIAAGTIKTVITSGMDRIGRNLVETIQLIEQLYELYGAKFVLVRDDQTSKDIVELANLLYLSEPLAQLQAVSEPDDAWDALEGGEQA